MKRLDLRYRRPLRMFLVLCAVGTFATLALTYDALVARPATYRTLQAHGVPWFASVHCGRDCDLTYVYAGKRRKHSYDNDYAQFCRCGRPEGVRVLIDPENPEVMYTAHDVARGTNAGLGHAVIWIVFAAVLAGLTFLIGRALRRYTTLRPSLPQALSGSPTSREYALDAIEEMEIVLDGGTFRIDATTVRFKEAKLTGAVTYVRERVAAVPGLDPGVLETADRMVRTVREATRVPLIGGPLLDRERLRWELDELRIGLLAPVHAS